MSIFSSTKMLLASLAVISSFAILSGCAMPAPAAMVTPFNVNEHSSYAGAGTSTITGSAFSVTKGGDVKIPAGNTLYLIPLTTYSKEALQKYYYFQLGGTQAAELKPYIRKTQIDAAGNFSFSNIPSGTYVLHIKKETLKLPFSKLEQEMTELFQKIK
jgi:hypothetical protein